MTATDPDEQARRMAAASLAAGDPTGWFTRLYAEAEGGRAVVPWDRGVPQRLLVQWADARGLDGAGRRALVVGCGLGADAEYIAGLGFDTVAFDIAEGAIREARRRHPGSSVTYLAADLLNLPASWGGAFDLVVESLTVQALPDSLRREAIGAIAQTVAPGGTLIVVAAARDPAEASDDLPPWPLTRAEVESFAAGPLEEVRIEDIPDPVQPSVRRWRAEFRFPRAR